MNTEDVISFETAKLLKERGFHQPVEFFYSFSGKLGGSTPYDWNQSSGDFQDYSCITLWMAMKWLREVHNKSIEIRSQGLKATSIGWIVEIYNLVNQDEEFHHPYTFPTYEEACEAAILYAIKNLI